MRRTIAMLMVLGVLLAGCGDDAKSSSTDVGQVSSSTTSTAAAPTDESTGSGASQTLTVSLSSSIAPDPSVALASTCASPGGGAVTVAKRDGSTIASGPIGNGYTDRDEVGGPINLCRFEVDLEVPLVADYVVSAPGFASKTISSDDLDSAGWVVELVSKG